MLLIYWRTTSIPITFLRFFCLNWSLKNKKYIVGVLLFLLLLCHHASVLHECIKQGRINNFFHSHKHNHDHVNQTFDAWLFFNLFFNLDYCSRLLIVIKVIMISNSGQNCFECPNCSCFDYIDIHSYFLLLFFFFFWEFFYKYFSKKKK